MAGRLRKFYEESVLLEQVFLIDDSKRKVSQVVEDKAKEIGSDIKLVGFAHFKLGDGVEKQETTSQQKLPNLSNNLRDKSMEPFAISKEVSKHLDIAGSSSNYRARP